MLRGCFFRFSVLLRFRVFRVWAFWCICVLGFRFFGV